MTTIAEQIEANIGADPTLITIDAAIAKYQLSERAAKRLRGKLFLGSNIDPAGSLERGLVHDDARLERFALASR